MAQLNTQKVIKIISCFLIGTSLAFCLTMVVILGVYTQQRKDTCHAVGYTDCDYRSSVYTYGPPFRNVTMKFIVDIITTAVLIMAGVTMVLCLQKTPKIVNAIILFCLLALTLMSLGCTIKSIDQEDKQNVKAFTITTPGLITTIEQGEAALLPYKTQLSTAETTLAAKQAAIVNETGTQLANDQAIITSLLEKIVQLKVGIATSQAKLDQGYHALNAINTLKDDYFRYRDSAYALELITFSLIYSFILLKVFYQLHLYLQAKEMNPHYSQAIQLPTIDPLIKGQSSVTENLEHIALQKGKSSNESEAVGFSTHV